MQPSLAGGLLVVLLAAVQVGPARARAYDCGVCMSSSSICVNWTGYSACSNGVGDALDAHPMSIRVPRSEVLEASQSSPFPVDENLNSISLKSNVPFLNVASCKTTFTVTGLRGSITSSSKALAVNNDTSQACARNGVWEMDEDAGTLVDQVAANTCFENSSWVNFAGKGCAAYLANKTMCGTTETRMERVADTGLILMDSSYIDTGGEGRNMSLNMIDAVGAPSVSSILSLGTLISRLSDTPAPGFVIIPEQEHGSIDSRLSSAQRSSLATSVSSGGRLVVACIGTCNSRIGTCDSRALLNVFGWSLTEESCSGTNKSSMNIPLRSGAPADLSHIGRQRGQAQRWTMPLLFVLVLAVAAIGAATTFSQCGIAETKTTSFVPADVKEEEKRTGGSAKDCRQWRRRTERDPLKAEKDLRMVWDAPPAGAQGARVGSQGGVTQEAGDSPGVGDTKAKNKEARACAILAKLITSPHLCSQRRGMQGGAGDRRAVRRARLRPPGAGDGRPALSRTAQHAAQRVVVVRGGGRQGWGVLLLLCLVGSLSDSLACLNCPDGKYWTPAGASVCSVCVAGKYSTTEGASVCGNLANTDTYYMSGDDWIQQPAVEDVVPGTHLMWQTDQGPRQWQWVGWQKPIPNGYFVKMWARIKFIDRVPARSWNFGFKIQGQVINDWVDGLTPGVWHCVSATAPTIQGGDDNLFILIFDSVAGPQVIHIYGLTMKVFGTRVEADAHTHCGASSCAACVAGKYSPTEGAASESSCAACVAGKYSPTEGAASESSCAACVAGKYSPTAGATTCRSCVAGKYSVMTEITEIKVGDVVVLQDGYAQVGDAGRGPLKPGAAGTVVEIGDQDFNNSNVCPFANDGACDDPGHTNYDGSDNQCFNGTDTADCNSKNKESKPAFSSSCRHLPDASLVVLLGAASEICQITHTNVRVEGFSSLLFTVSLFSYFQVGSPSEEGHRFILDDGSRGINKSSTVRVNRRSATSYKVEASGGAVWWYQEEAIMLMDPTVGATTCTSCTTGKYSNAASGVCQDSSILFEDGCAPGYYFATSADSSTCTPCNAGTHSSTPYATSFDTCLACEAGKYAATAGASVCTDCPAGTSSSSRWASSPDVCAVCIAGKYASPGSTTCLTCAAGKRSSAGASTCATCVAGTHSSALSETCSVCTPGTYSSAGSATCFRCATGKYSGASGASTCASICAAGKHSAATGASSVATCVECLAGKFTDTSGASVCSTCVAGKFSGGAIGVSACVDCAPGTYSAETSASTCTQCVAGKFATASGAVSATVCTACDAGTTSHASGAMCAPCAAGKYATSAASPMCTPCPAGTYSPSLGASTSSMCLPCAAGKFSVPSSAACGSVCPAGFYADVQSAACQMCPAGKYSNVEGADSSAACVNCAAGTYAEATASTTCALCVSGKFSTLEGATSMVTCVNCAAGKYSRVAGADSEGACTACAKGKYSQEEAASSDATCTTCGIGTFSSQSGVSVCSQCPASNSTNVCAACSAGKFLPVVGATSVSECVYCPLGSTTSPTVSCASCARSTFSPAGASSCSACAANMDSDEGSSACKCNAGFTGPDGGPCEPAPSSPSSPSSPPGQSETGTKSQSPGDPRVEFQVVLPYSLEGFTEAVQDTFKIAIAATASAGCECEIAKTDVDITRTTENAAPAGARRRLHAASITVDVSILVPDAKTGNLLVQSDALSREAMNDELVKRGLEPIAQVTSRPGLKSQDEDASALDSGDAASAGGASGAAVAIGITVPVAVIMLACAGWYFVRTRKKNQVSVEASQREEARKKSEEEAQRRRDEETRKREEEDARKRREAQVAAEEAMRKKADEEAAARKRAEEERERERKEAEKAAQKVAAEEAMRKKADEEAAARKRAEEPGRWGVDAKEAARGDDTVPHIQYSELAVESKALAAGSFKSVYRARWMKKARDVALLVLRNSDRAALTDMENEIRMFWTLGKHKHLAVLLATCTQPQSENKCMVMEFAPQGSLDHVLSKADEDGVDVSNLVKITIAMQVADAMAHLHLHNVVHRDLAIRNILVFLFDVQNWKNVLIKVTDYGLSLLINKGLTGGSSVVEIGTNSSNAAGPTRWMAPESIKRRAYSKQTDVWSFAVVLFEIWTLGMIPYHLIADDREVARLVLDGERLEQPDNCPEPVYAMMQDCWKSAPKDRPSMTQLQTALQEAFAEESLEAAKTECVVCLSGEPVMALMPCGHRCACAECGPMLETCPLCRTAVQEAKRIFG